jgi:hypothetical protein
VISIVVHGDSVGAESLRRNMVDWATDMHLVPAGTNALVDAYVGYYEPYATSHDALDEDAAFQAEVRNAAKTLLQAAQAQRSGRLVEPGRDLEDPRPK